MVELPSSWRYMLELVRGGSGSSVSCRKGGGGRMREHDDADDDGVICVVGVFVVSLAACPVVPAILG